MVKNLEGNIKFEDVKFAYPIKKEMQILKGLNVEIKKN